MYKEREDTMLNRKVTEGRPNLYSGKKLRLLRKLLLSWTALNANLNGLKLLEERRHSH